MRGRSDSRSEGRFSGAEAVLFDFDGTLVDASDAICWSFNAVARERGLAEAPEAAIRAMIGRPLREIFITLLPSVRDADLDGLVAEYRAVFGPRAVATSRLMPGAAAAVAALAAAGIALAVVTTRAADGAAAMLRAMGLGHHFATIVGLEHVARPKPHPEPVLRALETLGAAPERALMVGDTPDDVNAGRAAGASTIAVATGAYDSRALREAGADEVIAQLDELLPLLIRTIRR
jgi:HAD superfamily hydrolase (TIGR01509 family)